MRRITLPALLVLCAVGLFAREGPVGEVVYLEGAPQLFRRGAVVDDPMDFGTPLLNFDQIVTEERDFAELAIDPDTGIDAVIEVYPNSAFYLDVTSLQDSQRGGVEMLAGTISLNVSRLLGESELEVRTQAAVMGVRGTTFDVTIGVNGDLLVVATEGRVVCRDDTGTTLFATPNQAVEQRFDGLFRNVPVAITEADTFRREWLAERIEAFRASPLEVLRHYRERYLDLRERFSAAYRELFENRSILDKWMQEDRRGIVGSRPEQLREKRQVIGELLRLRRVLFVFERVYYRLVDLEANVQPRALRAELSPGLTVEDFLQELRRDRRVLARRMQTVRYVFRLYAERNDGSVPTEIGDSTFSEDAFADPDDFFDSDPFGNN